MSTELRNDESSTIKTMTYEELDAVAGAGGYADAAGGYGYEGGGGGFDLFGFGVALYNSTIGALGRMLG